MSGTILYLSPHFDDVVFSCPLHVLRHTSRGGTAVVATVFSEGDESQKGKQLYKARKEEDQTALSILGAGQHTVGLTDAPFRAPGFRSFSDIVLSETGADEPTLREVTDKIEGLLDQFKPETIVATLGVGTHIDHLLVHEAVRKINPADTEILFYEDRPYSEIIGATEFRLRQLGGELPPATETNWNLFRESFLAARYVERFLDEADRTPVLEALQHRYENSPPPGTRAEVQEFRSDSPDDSRRCLDAAMAYHSQVNDFLDLTEESARQGQSDKLWSLRPL